MTNLFCDDLSEHHNIDTELQFLKFKRQILRNYPWLTRYAKQRPIIPDKFFLLVKRLIDILLVIISLPIILPISLGIAFLIKIECPKGHILFRQQRTGKYGQRFNMYKFRTMAHNAEALKEKYMHLNELQWPDFKITNDPRITKIGHLLRKTSLDELPQLLNVLKNDMSLVGPRPTSFEANTYKLWQTIRLDIKPGITGLWQIIGRAEMEFSDRVYLDNFYIEHRSLMLDAEILIRTTLAVFLQRGAH